ncbi:MAG: glycosyltransferase family 2 protein [Candidatus Desulfofervidaceae bacterium]|nr:glycosyltransferase family 2 protein [Candidatus Desulfofervidaceae bacterium]MDL1970946.1 glycosyltransferase family 2 protein [Candidatus Desulfofervidaceae bacterium]
MPKLSAIIITYNEEKNIEACLKSVSWADEIIVVDSFSTDKTLEIAAKFTDKISQHPFYGYGKQKAFALSKASGEWILSIDADERVTPALKEEIEIAISNSEIAGYYLPRKNFFCGRWIRHSGWYPNYQLRLFKRGKARFDERLVHEKVVVNGKIGYLKTPLIHYTYSSLTDFLKKMQKYVDLWAQEKKKAGKKGGIGRGFFHGFWTFFKMFFLQAGFLDGRYGLLLASLYAAYTLAKYARLEELEKTSVE